MQSLFTYISGLLSVVVLFLQLWQFASLDRALLTAALTGLGAFLVLQLGYVAIRWILTLAPPRTEAVSRPKKTAPTGLKRTPLSIPPE